LVPRSIDSAHRKVQSCGCRVVDVARDDVQIEPLEQLPLEQRDLHMIGAARPGSSAQVGRRA
jgi:hypothetical protein